jgi:hypothetical protein
MPRSRKTQISLDASFSTISFSSAFFESIGELDSLIYRCPMYSFFFIYSIVRNSMEN